MSFTHSCFQHLDIDWHTFVPGKRKSASFIQCLCMKQTHLFVKGAVSLLTFSFARIPFMAIGAFVLLVVGPNIHHDRPLGVSWLVGSTIHSLLPASSPWSCSVTPPADCRRRVVKFEDSCPPQCHLWLLRFFFCERQQLVSWSTAKTPYCQRHHVNKMMMNILLGRDDGSFVVKQG